MSEDYSGAQAVARDMRAMTAASREANAAMLSTRGIASSGGGITAASGGMSLAGASGHTTGHGISHFKGEIRHLRRGAIEVREVVEGLATGDTGSALRGLRGLIGRGTGIGLAITLANSAVAAVEQGFTDRKEVADNLRNLQKESAKTATEFGYRPDKTTDGLVGANYTELVGERIGTGLPKNFTQAMSRLEYASKRVMNWLWGRDRDPEWEKESQEKLRKTNERIAKAAAKAQKNIDLGNIGAAEKEEANMIQDMGWENFKTWYKEVGTPAERYYRHELASERARLFSAFESPRKGPREEED
jgi:hypothetical protein